MKTLLSLTAIVFLTGCVATAPKTPSLAGTVWTGPYHEKSPSHPGGSLYWEFQPNGQLKTGPYNCGLPATWEQSGSAVSINVNFGYMLYTGSIAGATMSGTGHNHGGQTWTWSMRQAQ